MIDRFNFFVPTDIRFGRGAVAESADVFSDFKRAYIVTGPRSGRASGALHDVTQALQKAGVLYRVFEGISNNPTVEQCLEQGLCAREFGADVIMGIGGGSPLDAAKAVAVFAKNDISPERLFTYGYPNGILPIIAVPTTSGTGSEVTPWSVLTRHDKRTKCSFGGAGTFPKYALIDPKYTDSLSPDTTRNTAMDAFTHCLESIISIKATPITDSLNIHALKLFSKCMDQLERGCFDDIRDTLMLVSMMGGLTISQTGTTVMHSMGYPLTYFHGIPHGAANSYVLPAYLSAVKTHRAERLDIALDALGMDCEALASYARRNFPFEIKLAENTIEEYSLQASTQNSAKKTGIPCSPHDIKNMYTEMVML